MLPTPQIALIVDDDSFFRAGLRSLLMSELGCSEVISEVIEAACFDEAVERLDERHDISVVLFDLTMPGMEERAANLRVIRELFPSVRVVVVSASESRHDILSALEAGAHGYLPKSLGITELCAVLKNSIFEGQVYVPPFLSEISNQDEPGVTLIPVQEPTSMRASLTPRQEDVLNLVIAGKSNKEIARAMDRGEGTVKVHMAALFRILGVKSRVSLALAGERRVNGAYLRQQTQNAVMKLKSDVLQPFAEKSPLGPDGDKRALRKTGRPLR